MADIQNNDHWVADVIKTLAQDYIKEKRRKRRWGIFFKTLFLLWLIASLFILMSSKKSLTDAKAKPHAALIDIRGTIFDKAQASADNIVTSLRKAYKDKNTKGIILRINSPGGSPVQASYVFNEIMLQRKKHPNINVYAVCTDVCASAAYYIAAAANEIYADPSSIVGSIGVLYNGFGFNGAMQKLGVERRLITAGKNKGFMDPFSPASSNQELMLKNMLAIVHKQFEDSVKKGRGKRLKQTPDIFSGLFWTGAQAKQLGLIDDFGSAGYVARRLIKTDNVIDYTKKPNYFEKFAKRFGAAISDQILLRLGIGTNPIVSEIN